MKGLAEIRQINSLAAARRRSLPLVHCNTCDGTGKRPLTQVEQETLICIGRTWTPTHDVLAMVGDVAATALANRLAHLAVLGLVERRRVGRSLEWRLA